MARRQEPQRAILDITGGQAGDFVGALYPIGAERATPRSAHSPAMVSRRGARTGERARLCRLSWVSEARCRLAPSGSPKSEAAHKSSTGPARAESSALVVRRAALAIPKCDGRLRWAGSLRVGTNRLWPSGLAVRRPALKLRPHQWAEHERRDRPMQLSMDRPYQAVVPAANVPKATPVAVDGTGSSVTSTVAVIVAPPTPTLE